MVYTLEIPHFYLSAVFQYSWGKSQDHRINSVSSASIKQISNSHPACIDAAATDDFENSIPNKESLLLYYTLSG